MSALVAPGVDEAGYRAAWLDAMTPFWHVVARAADVPAGGVVPVELLGRRLALWRTTDGALAAVDARCPHRGVDLALGTVADDGCLTCPYHAWAFAGDGRCVRVPQLGTRTMPGADTTAARVVEADGFVWVCLAAEGAERRARPAFAELDAGTHWFWMGEPFDWAAQNLRQVENFCDVAHFSVIHLDTFGNPDGVTLEPTRVTRHDWCLRYDFDYPGFDPSVPPGPGRQAFPGRFEYRVELPCTVHLGGASGPGSVMFIHSSPLDVDRTRLFWGCAFPHGVEIDGAAYTAIEDAIWRPDLAMVASQRPAGLPLHPGDELHLPLDRLPVAFRRALAELGLPSSTPPPARRPGAADPATDSPELLDA